jgi:hypothetical protein
VPSWLAFLLRLLIRDRVDDLFEALLRLSAPAPDDNQIVSPIDVDDVATLPLRLER